MYFSSIPSRRKASRSRADGRTETSVFSICQRISAAVHGLCRKRRLGESLSYGVVEAHGILRRTTTAAPLAGLIFGIHGLAVKNFVAVRRRGANHAFVEHPSGNGTFFAEIGLHVQPIAAGLKDDDFATALDIGQFRGTRVGGEIKITHANQPATFGSKSCRSQEQKDQQKVFRFHERISASIFGSIFPPLITATLIEVCGSSSR